MPVPPAPEQTGEAKYSLVGHTGGVILRLGDAENFNAKARKLGIKCFDFCKKGGA
ncbi:hypothetical protein [Sinorhizobium arboris]|uniref:hypothetical protein n=1 Tax=Sinorhizobium arboris TaxID=76745 RepID=UPI000406A18A|nr:hypothetical protein [Sinorhizobium arboris]